MQLALLAAAEAGRRMDGGIIGVNGFKAVQVLQALPDLRSRSRVAVVLQLPPRDAPRPSADPFQQRALS